MFIKPEQPTIEGVERMLDEYHKDDDSSWTSKYSIQIYGSIATWNPKENGRGEMQYEHQVVQYAFVWQKSENS